MLAPARSQSSVAMDPRQQIRALDDALLHPFATLATPEEAGALLAALPMQRANRIFHSLSEEQLAEALAHSHHVDNETLRRVARKVAAFGAVGRGRQPPVAAAWRRRWLAALPVVLAAALGWASYVGYNVRPQEAPQHHEAVNTPVLRSPAALPPAPATPPQQALLAPAPVPALPASPVAIPALDPSKPLNTAAAVGQAAPPAALTPPTVVAPLPVHAAAPVPPPAPVSASVRPKVAVAQTLPTRLPAMPLRMASAHGLSMDRNPHKAAVVAAALPTPVPEVKPEVQAPVVLPDTSAEVTLDDYANIPLGEELALADVKYKAEPKGSLHLGFRIINKSSETAAGGIFITGRYLHADGKIEVIDALPRDLKFKAAGHGLLKQVTLRPEILDGAFVDLLIDVRDEQGLPLLRQLIDVTNR